MKILISIVLILAAAAFSLAQELVSQCPAGLVCISQAAANRASENARVLEATRQKVGVLEDALKSKDESIRALRETAAKNESDLREALKRTEIELATKTGQLISRESEVVRQSAIIQAMIPMLRKKRIGLINIF